MKSKLAYKIGGTLAAIIAATALSAAAQNQTAEQLKPAVPPVTAPTTAPEVATPPVDATVDATVDTPAVETPEATVQGSADVNTTADAAPAMDDVAPAVADAANPAKDFMREAYLANEFGIAAAQLAATKAESPEIKAAAQQVLDNGLKTRASMVATIQGSTSDMQFSQDWTDDYKIKLGDLNSATGADFDAKYVAAQGEVTEKAESAFRAYAAAGTDESVKTFAANTLPTLTADGDKIDSVAQGGN